MKKYFFLLLFIFGLSLSAQAQNGIRFGDGQPIWSATRVSGPILSVPNSTIQVCGNPNVGVPCTNLVTTYTDDSLGANCPSNKQVVLAGTATCQSTTDQFGNWGVWLPAGQYTYTLTTTGGQSFGPIPFSLSTGGGGGGGGTTITLQTNGTNTSSQTNLNLQNAGVFVWSSGTLGVVNVNFGSQPANFFIASPNGSSGIPTGRAIVAADIPAGSSCAANFFTMGLQAGLVPVCLQPSFSNLLGKIVLSQTPLTTNGDLFDVSGGVVNRLASAGGQDFFLQGANLAAPAWSAMPNCGDGTHALNYSTTTHLLGCQAITVGTGTINNATQYSAAYYSALGSANTVSGVAAPTTPSVAFLLCSTPSGGLATAPVWCEPGVPINAQTGASYTALTTDRENVDTMSNASPVAYTLPQAGSTGFDHNYNLAIANLGAGLVTVTPQTSTINGNATQIIAQNWWAFTYSDNTNYFAAVVPSFAAFGSTCTNALQWSTVTGAISCGQISLTAGVSGLLPIGSGGTNASTQQTALNNLMPALINPGDIFYNNGTNVVSLAGNTSGTQCLSETSGGVPSWGSCGGTSSWSGLTNPSGNLSLTMAANTSLFTYNAATGSGDMFKLTDTASNTGTGVLLHPTTANGSNLIPFQADVNGVGWKLGIGGNLVPVSTGKLAIPGTAHGLVISEGTSTTTNTTAAGGSNFPLLGQGAADPTFSAIAYPTSLTSGGLLYGSSTTQIASSALLTAHAVIVGEGAGSTPVTISADTTVSHALFATSGDPAFRAIGTSDASPNWYVAGAGTAQAQTATLSPAATALTAGLIVNWLPAAANTAAAPTLNVNSLGAVTITKFGTKALVANDLTTTNVAMAIYDGTEFILQNPQAELIATSDVETGASPPACVAGSAGVWCALEGTAFTNVSGAAGQYPDSSTHEYMAKTNGASSAGMMNRSQPGAINSTDQTAAISTATLCAASAGACNTAGEYEVHFDFIETGTACGTPGTGGVTFLLTWTDANGTAHSAVSLGMDDASVINAVSQTFHFQTSLGAAWASGQFTLSSNGSIIQYATGYTACSVGTGSYRVQAAVVRVQ